MDTHNGTQFREIADHHDDIVSFERASSARKAETSAAVPPAACGEGWYHDAAIAAADQAAIDARSNPYHH